MKKALSIFLMMVIIISAIFIVTSCGDSGESAKETEANAANEAGNDANEAGETPVDDAQPEAQPEEIVPADPVPGMVTVTKWYPSSSISEGIAAPANGVILTGALIGAEGGWSQDGSGNPDTGNVAAFDGDTSTFFDPAAKADPTAYCGLKTDKAYILTEIRICPRGGEFFSRFKGASIWGSNEDVFDPATATQIWVSNAAAEESVFQIITADQFIDGANTGFTHFIYFNQAEHGDVAEIELYGNPK